MSRARNKIIEIKCRQCYAYVPSTLKKCNFCGYKFTTLGSYFVNRIRQVLKIDRVFSLGTSKTAEDSNHFFTPKEIEMLIKLDNLNILMFLTLDNVTLLDEMALIEVAETFIKADNDYAAVEIRDIN